MSKTQNKESPNQSPEFLKNFSPSKIIIPILLGLGVVAYMIYQEFDVKSFEKIDWRTNTIFFILLAVAMIGVRLFAYSWRIRLLTDSKVSWKNAFQIIALWEFSSAITPSMIGGTAAGLFLLTKEKISVGTSTAIIFFTIFLDSFFFLSTIIGLWLIFGNYLISPEFAPGEYTHLLDGGKWVIAFLIAFAIMLSYTALIAYGLFVNPGSVKWLFDKVTKVGFLRRWNSNANKFGKDMKIASEEIRKKNFNYWIKGIVSSCLAWSARFLVVLFLVLAFVEVGNYLLLYGRQLSLYLILFLTPTPGGSGVADFAFKDFYIDFIGDEGLGALIGAIWRLLTYYPFLLLGVIVLPNWVKRVYGKSREELRQEEQMHH